jgi:hypothetical protein
MTANAAQLQSRANQTQAAASAVRELAGLEVQALDFEPDEVVLLEPKTANRIVGRMEVHERGRRFFQA